MKPEFWPNHCYEILTCAFPLLGDNCQVPAVRRFFTIFLAWMLPASLPPDTFANTQGCINILHNNLNWVSDNNNWLCAQSRASENPRFVMCLQKGSRNPSVKQQKLGICALWMYRHTSGAGTESRISGRNWNICLQTDLQEKCPFWRERAQWYSIWLACKWSQVQSMAFLNKRIRG